MVDADADAMAIEQRGSTHGGYPKVAQREDGMKEAKKVFSLPFLYFVTRVLCYLQILDDN